jgi:AcrR family transcriptional regulator
VDVAYLSAEERRARILDAAVEVIADEGLSRATTRRIAERADAPLGALHYCFRNKDELMELVLQRGAVTLRDAFEKVDASRGLEDTIRASVEAYWAWIRDNLGLTLALTELLMWAIRRGEHGKGLYAAVNAPFGGDLLRDNLHRAAEADGVTPALPVEELARFIIHRCDGLVFEYAASDDREACQRQADLLADAVVWLAVPGKA